jgi:RHS repeat-associated protein
MDHQQYGVCTCPEGTSYRLGQCLPVDDKTLKPTDMCANPIQPGTGSKIQTEIDYQGSGSFPLTFSRTYNSGAKFPTGWRSNYERSIDYSFRIGTFTAIVQRAEGGFPFTSPSSSSSSWNKDGDVQYSLGRSGGEFRLSSPDGLWIERYDLTNKIKSITDRAGTVFYTFTYSTASTDPAVASQPGLLIEVSNVVGQALAFTYDAQGRLVTMTDPDGGIYLYTYNSDGMLAALSYPDGTSRQYIYNEPAHTEGASITTALTGIIDGNGARYATYSYNGDGLAVGSEHAGGAQRHLISYSSAPTVHEEVLQDSSGVPIGIRRYHQPPSGVVITDALGEEREYSFVSSAYTVRASGSNKPNNGFCAAIPKSRTLDTQGNITSTEDFSGQRTCYAYDNLNRETHRLEGLAAGADCPANLSSYTPPVGSSQRKTSTTWHSAIRTPSQVNEPGRRTSFTHNGIGAVLTKTELDTVRNVSRVRSYTYNSYGQVLTINGPRTDVNDVTTYTYYNCTTGYQCGQVHTITDALGRVTTYLTYNAHGQPLTIQDPNGVVTTLTYDLRQRLTSRTVGTEVTSFSYWPTGLLKKATLPDGSYLEYTYDAAHRLIGVNDAEGNRVSYTLDAMGNRTAEEVFDPSNALTSTRTRVFNTLNRLSQEIGAAGGAGGTTSFGYDNNGNQTSINAPLGRNTAQSYDELNRLTSITDPASGVTSFGYNALDQLISVTDPRNKVTSYTYNALGDLLTQVSPDTGTTSYTYDSAGNVKTKTDARGSTVTYSYDALNRVTQAVWPDQTIQYGYDYGANALGRLTSVSDNSGSTSWTYDAHGRVTSRQQSMGSVVKSVGYGYDGAGRLSQLTLPSGHFVQYGYSNGKVTSLTLDGSTPILNNVLYAPFGPVSGWDWGNSTLAVRGFDLDGNVEYIDSAGLKSYGYDNAFRITSITDATDPSFSQSYGYDLLDRLTSAAGTSLNQSWTYDANGNRLSQGGSSSTSYSISSSSNRLLSTSGALTKSYTYDAAGNITSDGSATFTYDHAGRMVSSTKAGLTTAYQHNALGQRVKKSNLASTTYFVYDEAGHLIGEYDGSGNLIQEIIWLHDTPVASLRYDETGTSVGLFYIHTDHLNTPRRMTRVTDNAVVWRWESDPFGATPPEEDPDGNSLALKQNFRFPGQYYDAETGMHYNYARDYDPQTGRYIQSDPLGLRGGTNTYAYALNNPLTFTDPLGLLPICETFQRDLTRRTWTETSHTGIKIPGINMYPTGPGVGPNPSLRPPRRPPIGTQVRWEVWFVWRHFRRDISTTYEQLIQHMVNFCKDTIRDECGREKEITLEPSYFNITHDPMKIGVTQTDIYLFTELVKRLGTT